MDVDNSIYAVLNYEQIEKFCKQQEIDISSLKANFDGWRKLVLYTEEKIFLFPRNPEGIEWLDVEVCAYEFLSDYNIPEIPKFLERIKDPQISYYEFTAVSRLSGEAYSKFEKEITLEEITQFLENLAKLFSKWHNIPVEEIPNKIKRRKIFDETIYHWELELLDPKTTEKAFSFVLDKIKEIIEKQDYSEFKILYSNDTKIIWKKCIQEIVSLDPVLLHSDIHEDQILIDSTNNMKISGIIDWETTRVGNPVWEFNFFEWGYGIWNWWKHFSEFRRKMWEIYLKERNIELRYIDGLDLFYTLSEFLITLKPSKSLATLIDKKQEESIKRCLEKLVNITEKIKEKKK